MNPPSKAGKNLSALGINTYPGRGIVIGLDQTGNNLVQVYWIMGRSENSRNRIFRSEGGRLFTQAADPAKVKDPSLIIYNAMDEGNGYFVVSNGHQTRAALEKLCRWSHFDIALAKWKYEPDAPNFTPRITGCCYQGCLPVAELSIIRKSPWGNECERFFFRYDELKAGFGYCVTTYAEDGNPLPPFEGEPKPVPIVGNIQGVAGLFWNYLNEDNRVSLAVKSISITTGKSEIHIINKYKGVE